MASRSSTFCAAACAKAHLSVAASLGCSFRKARDTLLYNRRQSQKDRGEGAYKHVPTCFNVNEARRNSARPPTREEQLWLREAPPFVLQLVLKHTFQWRLRSAAPFAKRETHCFTTGGRAKKTEARERTNMFLSEFYVQ